MKRNQNQIRGISCAKMIKIIKIPDEVISVEKKIKVHPWN